MKFFDISDSNIMSSKTSNSGSTNKKSNINGSKPHTDDQEPNKADHENKDEELRNLGTDYSRDPESNNLVYTDPQTKVQYVLNSDKTDWILKTDAQNSAEPQYDFDGTTYFHTNSEGVRYKWDLTTEQWVECDAKESAKTKNSNEYGQPDNLDEEESEEDENTTDEDRKRRQYRKRKAAPGWGNKGEYLTDPETGAQLYKETGESGMTYEWDASKNAWFPRINEDFMAHYQMNYGFTPDGEHQPTKPEEPKEDIDSKKIKLDNEKPQPKKPQWFDDENEKSTKVYVTGLPTSEDYNEEKFATLMGKVSLIYLKIVH